MPTRGQFPNRRLWLFIFWAVPFFIYLCLVIVLPIRFPEHVSESQMKDALLTIGQICVPVVAFAIAYWFPSRNEGTRLGAGTVTSTRFQITLGLLGAYHVILALVFFLYVFFVDYTKMETYSEVLDGRINQFAKLASYLSLLGIPPLRFFFGSPEKSGTPSA